MDPPWGDYGAILISGLASRRADGTIEIERSGPFIPPVTIASFKYLLITDVVRNGMESAELSGVLFREAIKRRIVRIDWTEWDRSARLPPRLPPQNEPENYILRRKHNAALAEEIGPIWEVVLDEIGTDLRRGLRGEILVSERARDWLATIAPEWIRSEAVES